MRTVISCEMVTFVVCEFIFNTTCKQSRFLIFVYEFLIYLFSYLFYLFQWLYHPACFYDLVSSLCPCICFPGFREEISKVSDQRKFTLSILQRFKKNNKTIMRQQAVCEVIQLLVIFCTNLLISAFWVLLSSSHVVMDAHVHGNLL